MLNKEFSEQFDILWNNITSNQAPGLNEYEKSVVLTKAEKEVIKNHFMPNSKGNTLGLGYDASAKRQADFSMLMKVNRTDTPYTGSIDKIDDRSIVYQFPSDVYIILNESYKTDIVLEDVHKINRYQVIPLRFDEYERKMSKPFKRPLKDQVWRLVNNGEYSETQEPHEVYYNKYVELITDGTVLGENDSAEYVVRYIRAPKPIILEDLVEYTIDGVSNATECELDPILHDEILQRAIELAKAMWQGDVQTTIETGMRSE